MENHTLISTCFWQLSDCMKDDEIRLKVHCKRTKNKNNTLWSFTLSGNSGKEATDVIIWCRNLAVGHDIHLGDLKNISDERNKSKILS